ncbi:MAG: hypothetical protein V3T23_11200, partial [Nitrososphaerales archaeon]
LADPQKVLEETWRVLRIGGKIYCEVPFLYPVHHLEDYYRWTLPGLEILCSCFHKIRSGTCMGPFSAVSVILRRVATHRVRSPHLEAGIDLALGWVLSPLKVFDRVMSYSSEDCLVGGAFYFVGEKNNKSG